MKKFIFYVLLIVLFTSCEETIKTENLVKERELPVEIRTMKEKNLVDTLYYINSENKMYIIYNGEYVQTINKTTEHTQKTVVGLILLGSICAIIGAIMGAVLHNLS